jgi:TRAP-type C4-dicarboxylate transport system permease small subunit
LRLVSFRFLQQILARTSASAGQGLAGTGVLCVVVMMVLVTYEVGSRYLFNSPTTWSDEIASYLLIAIVFLGLAQNVRQGGHIRIDVVTSLLSTRARRALEVMAYGLGMVFAVMLLAGTWTRFVNFWARHTTSDSPLMTPLWIPMTPVLLGTAIFTLAMVAGFVISLHVFLTDGVKPVSDDA